MQCLPYAVNKFKKDHGFNPVKRTGQPDAYTYWKNVHEEYKFSHIRGKAMAFWKSTNSSDGTPGHAAYIDKIDDDGTIYFSYANRNGDGKIYGEDGDITFSDPYYMANDSYHVGKGLKFVGYVAAE